MVTHCGKILEIKLTPKLDYSKSPNISNGNIPIVDFNNVVLAPNQTIKSWFPFRNYPDKDFEVFIHYETLGESYKITYHLHINYVDNIDYLYMQSKDVPTQKDALVNITNTLTRFTEKF